MPDRAVLNLLPREIDDARSDAAEARWKKREKEMKDAIKAKINALRLKVKAKAKAKSKASLKAPKVKAPKAPKKAKAKKLARKGSTGSLGRKGSSGSLSKKPSAGDLKKTLSSGALKRTASGGVRLLEVGVDAGRRDTGQKWQFVENDKTWRDYKPDASAVVEQHYEEWEAGTGEDVTRKVKSGDWHYTVDFTKMQQQNADHHAHTKRRIRRVPDATPAGEKATGTR